MRTTQQARGPLAALLLLLLASLPISEAKYSSWSLVSAPATFSPGAFVFSLTAPAADLYVSVDVAGNPDQSFLTFDIAVNNATVWGPGNFSASPQPKFIIDSVLPFGTPFSVAISFYINGSLAFINSVASGGPLDMGDSFDVYATASPNTTVATVIFPISLHCVFTPTSNSNLSLTVTETASQLNGSSNFLCQLYADDVYDVADMYPAGTPFVPSVSTVSMFNNVEQFTVPGPAMALPSTALLASAFIEPPPNACSKVINVTVSGQFYTQRYYSCRIVRGDTAAVASNFALPLSTGLLVCSFNSSQLAYQPVKDPSHPLNFFTLASVYESLQSGGGAAQGVNGSYTPQTWSMPDCYTTHHQPINWLYLWVALGTSVASAAFVGVYLLLRPRPTEEKGEGEAEEEKTPLVA